MASPLLQPHTAVFPQVIFSLALQGTERVLQLAISRMFGISYNATNIHLWMKSKRDPKKDGRLRLPLSLLFSWPSRSLS